MTYVKVNSPFAKSLDGMMKDLFNDFPVAAGKTFREDILHFPPVNITDSAAAYLLEIAAPGLEKADFKVSLDGNVLTISTEKKEDKVAEGDKVVRKEFSYKAFKRSFTIDEKIDAENISAKYENGILKLELPKKEIVKAGVKDINIQ